MSGSKRPSFRLQAFALITASLLTSPVVLAQTVGPEPPQAKPQQENSVTKAIGKLLKQKQSTDKTDAKTQQDPNAGKPKAATPPQEPEMVETKRPPMLTQPPLTNAKIEAPEVDSANPPVIDHPKLDDPANPLGLTDAQNRLKRSIALLDGNRVAEAKPGLMQLRQWLVDVTEAHIGLYKTLNQIPSARAQAELEKELALQFAQIRDRAMLESARLYIAEKDYSKAVKELTEIVKSQPKSKIGLRSYEMLQEIGFTEKLQLTQ